MAESFIVLLRQLSYTIKNQLGQLGTQRPSLVLYGKRDRWLPCTERSYYRRPYAIKNQRRARNTPEGVFRSKAPSSDEVVLYGIRELA